MIRAKVELSGDFFRYDPGKTLYRNIGTMLEGLASEMEGIVRDDIRAQSMPYSVGWTADHVRGYTTSPKTGKHWALWAAVGIPTTGMSREQAIRTKAAAASVEARFHPWRRVKSAVYRSRAVLSANLSKHLE